MVVNMAIAVNTIAIVNMVNIAIVVNTIAVVNYPFSSQAFPSKMIKNL